VTAETAKQQRGRPWPKGTSGNPAGRRPGAIGRSTVQRLIEEGGGLTPMRFLLDVLADKRRGLHTRIEVAKALLPFCHPRLTTTFVVPAHDDEVIEVTLHHGGIVERVIDGQVVEVRALDEKDGPERAH
jgi:hypothetical protein